MSTIPFITRVVLQNYRSIRTCDVHLGPLMYLVGPNGSGKSNFLDALRFVSEAISISLEQAFEVRGGYSEVHARTADRNLIGIRLDFTLNEQAGHYAFEISGSHLGGFKVEAEECEFLSDGSRAFFRILGGSLVETTATVMPALVADRLALASLSGLRPFRQVYDSFTSMGFYNLQPSSMRELQRPQERRLLKHDGENISSILGRLQASPSGIASIIQDYLRAVVPSIDRIGRWPVGPMETIEFVQAGPSDNFLHFQASSMSDGTLRALGILIALFQRSTDDAPPVLVGIEEPETALHPAASAVLREAFVRAAQAEQVIVTSHSPDLLDDDIVEPEQLLAVISQYGETRIAPIDRASRETLLKHLFSAGELLRLGQLAPDIEALHRQEKTAALFGDSVD